MGRGRTWLLSLAGIALAHAAGPAAAGIATDGTVGPRVRLDGDFEIGADLGRRAGGNLFHSFERFSLGSTERATFSGPAEIRNVISRVTGGARSDIDGTLASNIAGADFYFINPAGVMFGPNASLEVQGSFLVSTANELRFEDGAIFSATSRVGNSFTHAPPEAFGFLDRSAGSITLDRASLPDFEGESVTLVGGDVVIDHGRIDNPQRRPGSGNVTLVAMSRPGAVRIVDGGTSAAPEGEIRITGEGAVPTELTIRHGIDVSSSSGGVVRIRAGQFEIEGAEIRADNTGDDPGVTMIDIQADHVRLRAGADVRSIARAGGAAGDVSVRAEQLDVLSGSTLRSDTLGAGNAGAVSVFADRRVLVSREGTGERTDISSSVGEGARGNGGSITVESGEIAVRDSGTIASVTSGAGASGPVTVTADRLEVLAGGQIGSGTQRQSTGRGGDVRVTMREEVLISGESAEINPDSRAREPSGIFTSTESRSAAAGPAGRVVVEAPVIRLADRGEIASESLNPDADATNPADSGSVEVRFVDLLEVDDAEITTKAEISNAGDITIRGPGVIDLRNGGQISTTVFEEESAGNAGDINVETGLLVVDSARIQANGVEGQGGNIQITLDQLIRSPDGIIQAIALSNLGIDGTVVISTPEADLSGGLVVLEGALLDAASQLRERCGARRDIGASSFTGVGRGGLPPTPDGPLAGAWLGRDAAVRDAQQVELPALGRTPADLPLAALSAPCAPLD